MEVGDLVIHRNPTEDIINNGNTFDYNRLHMTHNFSVKISDELYEKIQAECKKTGLSQSSWIRMMLHQTLGGQNESGSNS